MAVEVRERDDKNFCRTCFDHSGCTAFCVPHRPYVTVPVSSLLSASSHRPYVTVPVSSLLVSLTPTVHPINHHALHPPSRYNWPRSGFALLIFALGLTWLLHLRRSRNTKRQWQQTLRADVEKHPLDIQIVHSESAFDASLTHSEKLDQFEQPFYNYHADRFTSKPQPHSRTRRAHARPPSELLSPYDLRRTPAKPPSGLSSAHAATLTVPTSVALGISYDSSDTASMYSTASAPIDLHDQILLGQPMSGHWHSQPSPVPVLRSPRQERAESRARSTRLRLPNSGGAYIPADCIDPLAPETYDKTVARHSGAVPLFPVAETPTRAHFSDSVRKQRTRKTPKDHGTLPPHMWPTLDPPTPLAQRDTLLLYRKVPHPSLPSPYSPPPAEAW
ncbi:hypothetical protein BJ912DRAFT_921338 [Pholiota molesta]|nr:hypothetical protein BJ912DRAFT_921338 [Pholiota molesta]